MTDNNELFSNILENEKKILLEPRGFYQAMPTSGGYLNPIVFVICMLLAGMFLYSIFALLFGTMEWSGLLAILVTMIIVPVFGIIGSFIGALIMHLIWQALGSSEDFEASYRSVAYAYGIFPVFAILNHLPYIGTIIYTLWFFGLMVLASQYVHKIDYQKAFNVLGIISIVMVLLSLIMEYSGRKVEQYADEFAEKAGKYEEVFKDATPEEMLEGMTDLIRELEQKGVIDKMKKQIPDNTFDLDSVTSNIINTLKPTETIEPFPDQKLILDINESSLYAETLGPTELFETDQGQWHKLTLEAAYYSDFKSLNRDCMNDVNNESNNSNTASVVDAAEAAKATNPVMNQDCAQKAKLRNAMVYAYDSGGNPVRGVECSDALLFYGDEIAQGDSELWLFCPKDTYKQIQE